MKNKFQKELGNFKPVGIQFLKLFTFILISSSQSSAQISQFCNGGIKVHDLLVASAVDLGTLKVDNLHVKQEIKTESLHVTDSLIVGLGGVQSNGGLSTTGFTKVGSESELIKIKTIAGTTSSIDGESVIIDHDLFPGDFISVSAVIYSSPNEGVSQGNRVEPGFEFDLSWTFTLIKIQNQLGNSSQILGKPFIVTILYKD